MQEEYRPLELNNPDIKTRAQSPPRPPRFWDYLDSQKEIAENAEKKVRPFVRQFSQLTREQQRAIFYKITHSEMRIDLRGTGLKVFADGENYTLAGVRGQSLDRLLTKISEFKTRPASGGHLRNENLVIPLSDFEIGDPKDRLSEEFLSNYEQLIQEDSLLYEIELMSSEQHKNAQSAELQEILSELQSTISLTGVIFETERSAEYIRAVIRTSGRVFQTLVENEYWQSRIIRFEQRPQFETFHTTIQNFQISNIEIEPPEISDAAICVLDSGVNVGNPFLTPVVKENQCFSFLTDTPEFQDEYSHGSGVASLAAFENLNLSEGAINKARAWITCARILDQNNQIKTRLFSSIISDVVKKFVPLGVRIFNLSVCVENRPWNEQNRRASKRSSWIARRIDQLSKDFDIVFVVSAGNLKRSLANGLSVDGGSYPAYFLSDECKILDPSQAVLAITVGSVAPGALITDGRSMATAEQYQPSPFTRVGPGIMGEIKPEVVDFGGNWVSSPPDGRMRANPGTDVFFASNQITPAVEHGAGTSYAAPKISYKLARILHDLSEIVEGTVSSNLMRAFLINCCTIKRTGSDNDEIASLAQNFSSVSSLSNILGYGTPDLSKSTSGDMYTATCYFQGIIETDKVAFFRIPIPSEFVSAAGKKRIYITVAYSPDVHQSGLKDYLGARVQWRLFRGDANENDVVAYMSREGVEEENSETDQDLQDDESSNTKEIRNFRYGLRTRSKGTIQHDIYEWTHHRTEFSNNDYLLAVSVFKRWSSKSIPLAIVVRIEDASYSVPVYLRVKAALVQARVRAAVNDI